MTLSNLEKDWKTVKKRKKENENDSDDNNRMKFMTLTDSHNRLECNSARSDVLYGWEALIART